MSLKELMTRTETPCDSCAQGIEKYLIDLYEIGGLVCQPKLCHACIGKRAKKEYEVHPFDEIGLTEEEMISLGFYKHEYGFWKKPDGVSNDRLLELLTDMRNMPPDKPHFCKDSDKNEE